MLESDVAIFCGDVPIQVVLFNIIVPITLKTMLLCWLGMIRQVRISVALVT